MTEDKRDDLAAMIMPIGQALLEIERPVLRAHGISMWAYSVLTALAAQPARTQTSLAKSIGADKTRIIGVLDELQERGLIRREPDPADRRAHLLSLTEQGRALGESTQADIQRAEQRLLAHLSANERDAFLRALARLSALPPNAFTPGDT